MPPAWELRTIYPEEDAAMPWVPLRSALGWHEPHEPQPCDYLQMIEDQGGTFEQMRENPSQRWGIDMGARGCFIAELRVRRVL